MRGVPRAAGRSPTLLLTAIVMSAPFLAFSIFNYGERGVPPVLAFAALYCFGFLWAILSGKRLVLQGGAGWVALFLLSSLLSIFGLRHDALGALTEYSTVFTQVFIGGVLAIGIAQMGLDEAGIRRLLKVWMWTAVGVALFGIYQGIAPMLGFPDATLEFNNASYSSEQRLGGHGASDFLRRASVFPEPGWYGAYILYALILVLILVVVGCDREILFPKRWRNLALAGLLGLALLQSGSLGAYAIFLFTVSVFFIRERKAKWVKRLAVMIVGMVLLALVFSAVLNQPILSYFVDTNAELGTSLSELYISGGLVQTQTDVASLNARLNYFSNSLSTWWDSSFFDKCFGLGLNYFKRHPADTGMMVEIKAIPMAFLSSLVDQGLLGLLALAGLFWRLGSDLQGDGKWIAMAPAAGSSTVLWPALGIGFKYVVIAIACELTINPITFQHWFMLGLAILVAGKLRPVRVLGHQGAKRVTHDGKRVVLSPAPAFQTRAGERLAH